jgi:hypothetical protein
MMRPIPDCMGTYCKAAATLDRGQESRRNMIDVELLVPPRPMVGEHHGAVEHLGTTCISVRDFGWH